LKGKKGEEKKNNQVSTPLRILLSLPRTEKKTRSLFSCPTSISHLSLEERERGKEKMDAACCHLPHSTAPLAGRKSKHLTYFIINRRERKTHAPSHSATKEGKFFFLLPWLEKEGEEGRILSPRTRGIQPHNPLIRQRKKKKKINLSP